jgi:hypothetical protein
VADLTRVRAALDVDLAQEPVDVGQQAALDVSQLGVGARVDQHQLGEHVAVGAGDLQGDGERDDLARRQAGAADLPEFRSWWARGSVSLVVEQDE